MAMDIEYIGGRSTVPTSSHGEYDIYERLNTTLGHTITWTDADGNPAGTDTITAAEVVTATSGDDMAFLGSSAQIGSIDGDIFNGLAVPVMTTEGGTWDSDRFASSSGETSGTHTQITILAPSHPAAAGLSGDVTVYSSAKKMNYATASGLCPGATAIASVKGDSSKIVLWVIESGGELDDGNDAAARRGGWLTTYDASEKLTSDGWDLFDAMVEWVGNEAGAITPSGTHSGTDNHYAQGYAIKTTDEEPTVKVYCAFGVDWDTEPAALDWDDVTDDVLLEHGISGAIGGRTANLGATTPGHCNLTFTNRNRDYETGYTGGAHYPNIRPMTHIKVEAEWGGVTFAVWRGYVLRWGRSYPGSGTDAITRATCIDIHAVLANSYIDGGHLSTHVSDVSGALHWPLDEQSGSTFRETLTPTTSAITATASMEMNDDTFHASPAKRKYVYKGTASEVFAPTGDFSSGAVGEITIGAWMRTDTTSATWTLFEVSDTDDGQYAARYQIETDGGVTSYHHDDGTATATTVSATSDVMDGEWHYVMLIRRGSGTSWTDDLFVDGVAVATAVTGPVETPGSNSPSEVEQFGETFIGWMGEVSFIPAAITDVAATEIYNSWLDVFPRQSTDERIGLVLDYINVPTELRAIDAGASTMTSRDQHGERDSDVIDRAAEAEFGLFFVDQAGMVTFHNRARRKSTNRTLEIGAGQLVKIAEPLEMPDGAEVMLNTVVADIAEGTDSASAVDEDCRDRDGERRHNFDLQITATALGQSYVDHVLATRKSPGDRIDTVTIRPRRDPTNMFQHVLAARMSDRITVHHDPVDDGGPSADIEFTGFIEGIGFTIDDSWEFQWRLSPEAFSTVSF